MMNTLTDKLAQKQLAIEGKPLDLAATPSTRAKR